MASPSNDVGASSSHTSPPAPAAAVVTATGTILLPRVTIQFCTQCKWLLRAAYVRCFFFLVLSVPRQTYTIFSPFLVPFSFSYFPNSLLLRSPGPQSLHPICTPMPVPPPYPPAIPLPPPLLSPSPIHTPLPHPYPHTPSIPPFRSPIPHPHNHPHKPPSNTPTVRPRTPLHLLQRPLRSLPPAQHRRHLSRRAHHRHHLPHPVHIPQHSGDQDHPPLGPQIRRRLPRNKGAQAPRARRDPARAEPGARGPDVSAGGGGCGGGCDGGYRYRYRCRGG